MITYFSQSFELGDGLNGSKDLILENLHVVLHIAENCGLDVVALATQTSSACIPKALKWSGEVSVLFK